MELKNFTKHYSEKVIFNGLDLSFADGTITAVLGNSGVGKTTLLNALASLDNDYSGQVVTAPCSYIFQEPRLLKGATVLKNVELACKNSDVALKYLAAVELDDYANKYPKQLSGGMAQRVSMARAFAAERPLLLMDEPFSSLDLGLKFRLYDTFRSLWQKTRPTTVFITHDLDEALELGDRIVLLKGCPAKVVLDTTVTDHDRAALKEILRAKLID